MEEEILEGLSPRDYARVLFKGKGLVFLIFLVSTLVVSLYSFLVLPTYEAQGQILLVAQASAPIPFSEKLTAGRTGIDYTFIESKVILGNPILGRVVQALHLDTRPKPKGLKGAIQVFLDETIEKIFDLKDKCKDWVISLFIGRSPESKPKPTAFDKAVRKLGSKNVLSVDTMERTDILTIRIRDYDPIMAAKVVNALCHAYILYRMETQIKDLEQLFRDQHPEILRLKQEIALEEKALKETDLAGLENLAGRTNSGDVKFLEFAVPPVSPKAPSKALNIGLAMLVSLIVGVGYVFFLEIMNQTIKSPRDIGETFKVKMLGSIPTVSSGQLLSRFPIPNAETQASLKPFLSAVHDTASEIFMLCREKKIKTLLFASLDDSDGKTLLTLHLASELQKMLNGKVLVVDANGRHPTLDQMVHAEKHEGLSDLDGGIEPQKIVFRDPQSNLSIVPVGKQHHFPPAFFSSEKFRQFMEKAKAEHDLILVDTPSFRQHKDALSLSGSVDGAVFVVSCYSTRKHLAGMAQEAFQQKGIPVLGAILNFREYVIPDFIYHRL